MKKSRGQDRMDRHNQEIDMKMDMISNQVDRIAARAAVLNYRIAKRLGGIHAHEGIAALKEQFKNGIKITKYNWTYEYSFLPSRRCFTNEKLILPGTKAYKGIFNHGKTINKDGFFLDVNIYPEEIWVTKGEFTMRKLKGQL